MHRRSTSGALVGNLLAEEPYAADEEDIEEMELDE